MYSLNQDRSVLEILNRLGLLDITTPKRSLPFRPCTRIPTEAVRPVYWQQRPKSYVQRTSGWQTLPQAAWAEVQCAALLRMKLCSAWSEMRLAAALLCFL
jgi:methylenetetrahydrofolate reductase (NADPH)